MDENFKLSFRDLFYRVKPRIFSKEKSPKDILKGINGNFNGSELTAIIGLSGSGKSSLLDCLSGFRVKNVSGSITINDRKVSIRKYSSYIMQEYTLHDLLTVFESMMLSLNLKNSVLTKEEKVKKIKETLSKLNIELKCSSLVKDLSGGEQKRLSIAIELIHNPKILFVDEPTTGLDSFASTNCVHHLKRLALEGKTVIITIHQPSALILSLFDHVYALAEGQCIYQGTSDKIVPFLSDIDLICPSTYNPADFLLEIANNDYGNFNQLLREKIMNGLNDDYRKSSNKILITNGAKISVDNEEFCEEKYFTNFTCQVYYLMLRTFLVTSRDKTLFLMRILIHLFIGLGFGFIYKDVGNNGVAMFDNYRFLVVSVVFLLYTSYHSHIITFPLEFPIIKREHFNGWYSTRAFYSAFILFDLPITIVCCTTYVAITYWMTDQPRELYRFLIFLGFTLSMSFAAHILGIAVTALMNVKFATIFGTFFLMPCFLFSAIMILTNHTHPIFRIFFELNFLDNALKGVVNSVLGFDRAKIPCDEIFCHFGNPKKVIRDFGVSIDMRKAFSVIFLYIVVFQVVSFVLIRFRLKNRH